MKDTFTPEDKARLARFNLLHQYDPPPFGRWILESVEYGNPAFPSAVAWCQLWMFSRIWRMVVKHGG